MIEDSLAYQGFLHDTSYLWQISVEIKYNSPQLDSSLAFEKSELDNFNFQIRSCNWDLRIIYTVYSIKSVIHFDIEQPITVSSLRFSLT